MKRLVFLVFTGFLFAKEYNVDSIQSLQNTLLDIPNISEEAVINIEKGEYNISSPLFYSDNKNQKIVINGNDSLFKGQNSQIFVIDNNLSKITINNLIFENGETNDSGGAILSNGDLIINYSKFINNKSMDGGAVNANNITLTNTVFKNNEALYGGAVDALGNLNIDSCNFKFNTSKYGGAAIAKQAYISKSNFSYNSAQYGGAVSVDNNFTIINSDFEHNSAQYGGAIVASTDSYLSADRFQNNFATYGGAILIENGITVKNSVFLRNTASYGGAIVANSCNINNSTFLHNFATTYASAIYAGGKIENSIFLDKIDEIVLSSNLTINSSSIDKDKIFKDTYNLSLSNIYDFNASDLSFINDFRLSSASKAVGKANSNATAYDFDGNQRDSSPDIGASEFTTNPKIAADNSLKIFINQLHSGWNLAGLGKDASTNSDAFSSVKSVWTYRNGKWFAYTTDSDFKNLLQKNGINILEKINSNEGVWINK